MTIRPEPARHRPVQYLAKPAHWNIEIAANSFTLTSEDVSDNDIGLGGEVEDTLRCYVDVFGQDDQFGMHSAADVRDILCGKMPSIGRNAPFLDVYDFREGDPGGVHHTRSSRGAHRPG